MSKQKRSGESGNSAMRGKTYYPAKTFDDDLVALVDLFKTNEWAFSGVDITQLESDSVSQREERQAYDADEAEWRKTRAEFGIRTEMRHRRFSAALCAARGAFRNDKAVTAQLEKFKRSIIRRGGAVASVVVIGNTAA